MQTQPGHTLKAFDEELETLRTLTARMGGLAETAIREAVDALMSNDAEAAAHVVEGDHNIDSLQAEIEGMVVRIIALRAPMAADLRDVVAALKISGILERIGDYGKNIAKRVPILRAGPALEPLSLFPEMAKLVAAMVHDSLDAFVRRDAEQAVAVCRRDSVVDGYHNGIFRALLTVMMEDPHSITAAAHLLFVAKHLERIGDHATNMAEMVYFAATGQHIADRPRQDALLDPE